jgi:hypothetical protein
MNSWLDSVRNKVEVTALAHSTRLNKCSTAVEDEGDDSTGTHLNTHRVLGFEMGFAAFGVHHHCDIEPTVVQLFDPVDNFLMPRVIAVGHVQADLHAYQSHWLLDFAEGECIVLTGHVHPGTSARIYIIP